MGNVNLALHFPAALGALAALDRFEQLARQLDVPTTMWSAYDSGDEPRPGGLEALREFIAAREPEMSGFGVRGDGPLSAFASRSDRGWWLGASKRPARRREPDPAWMKACVDGLRALAGLPDLIDGAVHRGSYGEVHFPARVPIAANAHAVLVTPAQVEAAYDQPEAFWRAWDSIEELGTFRLCVRALDRFDWERWLGDTFERTMMLARAAKPGLTEYSGPAREDERPWWDFGDPQDEKAGYPMLELVGYDPSTRTLEYAAKPGHRGHVLLQEIFVVRVQLHNRKTVDGEPLDAIRIVFLDEATARAEKRPLLDAGARVYFTGRDGHLVEVTD